MSKEMSAKIKDIEMELLDYIIAFDLKSHGIKNQGNQKIISGYQFDDFKSFARLDQNFPIRSHRRKLGKIIVFFKKAVRRIMRWYVDPIINHQNQINNKLITLFSDYINQLAFKIEELEKKIEKQVSDQFHTLNEKLLQLEEKYSYFNKTVVQSESILDYSSFEEKYRGTWELIRDRQKKFLKFFSANENVLDIGCGRGEFVSLLIELGVQVVGVDINYSMLSVALEKGLPVKQIDGKAYLEQIPDASLDGIFMSHVIEHIPVNEIIPLLELCNKKLRNNGRIILETPNPLSLAIFSRSFYIDPTHIKPVHPETLKFMLNQVGFILLDVILSGEIEEKVKLDTLDSEQISNELLHFVNTLNNNIEKLNDWLYGPQDYAVVAIKK